MVARFTGAVLGLMGFGVAALAGIIVGNPISTILSRAVWSLILFCIIGLCVGAAAQLVIAEHEARKRKELFPTDEQRGEQAEPASASPSADARSAGS